MDIQVKKDRLKPKGKLRTCLVHNLPEVADPSVFFHWQAAFFSKITKALLELPVVFGAHEHQIHMGVGQAEAIPISCLHDRSVPIFWGLKETLPSRGCVGDNKVMINLGYGGEEFTMILPFTNGEGALMAGERIRARFESHDFIPEQGQTVYSTLSVGVAQYRTGETIDALTKRADKALYEAKTNGNNKIRFLP